MKEIRRCAKFDPHSSKQHTRGSGIVRGHRLATHAHPRARGQGVRVPFRWWHKRHGSREEGGRAQQRSLSGLHSSKRHTRGSGIVRGHRLATHAHTRARGRGVRVPVRTLHALAGQTHTMVLGCRGVKEAPNGARAWRDDWKYGGVPRTGAQDALRCLVSCRHHARAALRRHCPKLKRIFANRVLGPGGERIPEIGNKT